RCARAALARRGRPRGAQPGRPGVRRGHGPHRARHPRQHRGRRRDARAVPPPPVGARAPRLHRERLGRRRHAGGDGARRRPVLRRRPVAPRGRSRPPPVRGAGLGGGCQNAGMTRPRTDVLGAPYTAETLDLPDDDEGRVVATLVRRRAGKRTSQAVLHVHRFADYLLQTAYAEWWTGRGYDFYALDLRKYGRSILPHQTPNYVADLAHYHPELDLAWDRVTSRHRHVVLSGHSTGGLTVPLWAEERGVTAGGMVLNAPWFDLQ